MKRRKPLKRTRFKRKKPNGTRAKSTGIRDAYLGRNPLCEWRCGRRACEVDHIIQLGGATFETNENYFATCRKCHERKHKHNLRGEQIRIKVAKGEYCISAAEELWLFGRTYYFDARDIEDGI